MTTEKNKQSSWYQSMTFKMFLLGTMAILFLIPLQLIKIVIGERENNSNDVVLEISEQWGKKQIITGPVLNIPIYRNPVDKARKSDPDMRVWHILPDRLDIAGTLEPETRKKSIYETVIYTSFLKIEGCFNIPDRAMENYTVLWDEAYLSLGISDNHGLVNQVEISFSGLNIPADPGLIDQDVFSSGLTFPVKLIPDSGEMKFSLDLDIKGSEGIFFTPVGKTSSVKLSSSWPSPSFSGKYIPSSHNIDEAGFTASWETTHLNRNFPQEWIGRILDISEESFGTMLLLGVDHYQKSERSAKYGLLFIAFTFLILLFIELSSDKRVHIFGYFLVSLALVLFFSLLNALSEHIGFNAAYIIASIAIISMVSGFSGILLRDRKKALIMALMLTVLYAFLFFLLSLNEYAYLAGNLGLFIGLGAIMWLTGKTDLFRKNDL